MMVNMKNIFVLVFGITITMASMKEDATKLPMAKTGQIFERQESRWCKGKLPVSNSFKTLKNKTA